VTAGDHRDGGIIEAYDDGDRDGSASSVLATSVHDKARIIEANPRIDAYLALCRQLHDAPLSTSAS